MTPDETVGAEPTASTGTSERLVLDVDQIEKTRAATGAAQRSLQALDTTDEHPSPSTAPAETEKSFVPLSPALLRIAQVLASSEELTVAELRATASRESVLALDAVRVINEWAEQVAPLRGVELKDPPVEVDSVRNGVWVDPVLGDLLT